MPARSKLIPVILSGGSGTRLWPLSREASPKPFIPLPDGESLLVKAFKRASMREVTDLFVITRDDLYFRTKDHFEDSGVSGVEVTYLLEPFGRNTAAAVKLATLVAKEKFGDDVVLLILSADHLIDDQEGFANAAREAAELAAKGHIVTFGISPSYPETGYGYIERGESLEKVAHRVARFTEKPDRELAEEFVRGGMHYWNAGIFSFRADAFLSESEKVAADILVAAKRVLEATDLSSSPIRFDKKTFADLPDVSVDKAVMERSSRITVVPASFDWKDVGSWGAIAELSERDEGGNVLVGETYTIDTQGSFVHSPHRFTATIGVNDLVIVDTPDALLVAHKDRAQEVKKVAEHLKRNGHEAYLNHRTAHRPWGTYTVLEEGSGFKLKRIVVKPGASLSLQSHEHRSEHWVIVSGRAKIVNGDEELFLDANEGTFVKAGDRHRLSNPGDEPLVMIETQVGGYLGEDDIVRHDDHYGRS